MFHQETHNFDMVLERGLVYIQFCIECLDLSRRVPSGDAQIRQRFRGQQHVAPYILLCLICLAMFDQEMHNFDMILKAPNVAPYVRFRLDSECLGLSRRVLSGDAQLPHGLRRQQGVAVHICFECLHLPHRVPSGDAQRSHVLQQGVALSLRPCLGCLDLSHSVPSGDAQLRSGLRRRPCVAPYLSYYCFECLDLSSRVPSLDANFDMVFVGSNV